jgi:hypothetical protein
MAKKIQVSNEESSADNGVNGVAEASSEVEAGNAAEAASEEVKKDELREKQLAAFEPEANFKLTYAIFDEPEGAKHSFDLEFILDVLKSLYDPKLGCVVTRDSGATLLQNTYKPIPTIDGPAGLKREVVFSYLGDYFLISASCLPQDNQLQIDWDSPLVSNQSNQVMAIKVDPVEKVQTVYVKSAT